MSRGPSPFVPLLLVGALGWLTLGSQLLEGWSSIAELQETWIAPIIITPFIFFLLVIAVNEVIVIPLILILVAFLFKAVVIAPLILLLLIIVINMYRSTGPKLIMDYQPRYSVRDDGEGWFGFGGFILVMLFFVLSSVFCQGECYWCISLMLVLPFLYFFSSS